MAKQSGLGDNLYVAGYDLSGDISAVSSVSGSQGVLEVTGINKHAFERIGGIRSGSIEFSAYFNPSENQAHERLSALPTSNVLVTYCRGTSQGSPAACMMAKQINYDGSRGDDGAFTFSVSAQSDGYGLEWGNLLTDGIRNDSSGASGTSVAASGSTDNGLQAYLQVFGFTGTSATIKIQESGDDGVADTWADLGSFTTVSGITSERIAVTGTVEKHLRVITSGTFSALSFAVVYVRNLTETSF